MKSSPALTLALAVFLVPLFALYGLVVVVRGVVAVIRFVRATRRACAQAVECPNGHSNATVGRWACATCHGEYHGWVGQCSVCGAKAGWFPCETCGAGIRFPWER
jgi:hypothetical protein